jgi:hypothetical protein
MMFSSMLPLLSLEDMLALVTFQTREVIYLKR